MIEKDKISVLIATYNRAELLKRCLDSVFKQNYKDFEVIVINDCSTDSTLNTLKIYKKKFPEIFFFKTNKRNYGISYCRNLGFKYSTGNYIVTMDDDDEWIDKDKLLKQLKYFKKNEEIAIIATFWQDIADNKVGKIHRPNISHFPLDQILRGNSVYHTSSVMILREAWLSVNGFDSRLKRGTDSDLYRNIIRKGWKTQIIPEIMVNVHIDGIDRITPVNSLDSLKKDIHSNEICLSKYKKEFKLYPSAKWFRKRRLVKKYLKLMYFEPRFSNLIRMVKGLFS